MIKNRHKEMTYYQICRELSTAAVNGSITNSRSGFCGGKRTGNPNGEWGYKSETFYSKVIDDFKNEDNDYERIREINFLLKDISKEGILSNYTCRRNYVSFDGESFEEDTIEVLECIACDDQEIRATVYGKGGKLAISDFGLVQGKINEIRRLRKAIDKKNTTGRSNVILDPEAGGLLTAMLVGYLFEGDRVTAGTSYLFNHIEKYVQNSLVTVIDRITPDYPVYFTKDEEGTLSQHEVVLINEGKIGTCLTDSLTADLLDTRNNGRSRSQDYRFIPLPRIANIVLKSSSYSFKDLLSSVGNGIYCIGVSGAAVDVASGVIHMNFQAACSIKNGELDKPIGNTSLSINIFEFIQKIKLVGNDERIFVRVMGKGRPLQNHIIGFGSPHLVLEDCYVR